MDFSVLIKLSDGMLCGEGAKAYVSYHYYKILQNYGSYSTFI
jgi:hypothetical protein